MATHPDKHIFNPSGCIRLEALQEYMKGGFPKDIREEISMHLEECQLCKEAMEGLTLIPDPLKQHKSIRTIREGMKGRIRRRKMSTSKNYGLKRRFNWVAAAASIILLTGVFSIYNYLLKNDRDYIAEELNIEETSGKITDSILNKGIIDHSSPQLQMTKEGKKNVLEVQSSPPHKEKGQGFESEKIPREKENIAFVLSDPEIDSDLLIDSIPAAVVSESVVSSPLAEVSVINDEIAVYTEEEETEKSLPEKVALSDISSKRVTGVASASTEIEYSPASLRKTKRAEYTEPNVVAETKSSLTKPIFQDIRYIDFEDYLGKTLIYPDSALKANLAGRVILEFTIDENGIISELKVRESSHKIFEEEACRLISSSGIWQPAIKNGQAVSYLMFLPIDFIPPDKK